MSKATEIAEFNATLTPAIIQIDDREQFEKMVNEVATTYKNYIVTAETLKDDKKVRASLNRLSKQLDDKRKDIKRDFNKPLDEFQTWFKKAQQPLINAVEAIDTGIKELEEHDRLVRADVIKAELKELTKETEIDPRVFDEKIDSWNKASNFKNFEIKDNLKDTLEVAVDYEKEKIEIYKNNAESISNFCFESNISDAPYLISLREGKELSDILDNIREQIKRDKELEEKRKAQMQEAVNRQLEKDFNTPQKINDIEEAEENSAAKKEEVKYVAKIDIEFDSIEEKEAWKEQMIESGFKFNVVKFGKVEVI